MDAFLLSREWRDRNDGVELVLWARAADTPVCARFPDQDAVMFVRRQAETRGGRRRPRPLTTLRGEPVDAVYFRSQRAMLCERDRLRSTLARDLRLESRLELKFEAHYLRFLMPTMRAGDRGSKKRYAGAVRRSDGSIGVVVRGLEAVRTDWTPLARRVQLELLRRVFSDEPFEAWLVETVRELVSGRLDDELVYRKRVRRELGEYAQGGAPPHVQAARMLDNPDVREVEYVITTRGPVPIDRRSAPIDHAHYLEKQLAPACDVVLPFLGTSFEAIAGAQRSLF